MIEINVYSTKKDWVEHHSALCRRIDFEDSLKVDINSIVSTMRCLFGSDCVTSFVYVP